MFPRGAHTVVTPQRQEHDMYEDDYLDSSYEDRYDYDDLAWRSDQDAWEDEMADRYQDWEDDYDDEG